MVFYIVVDMVVRISYTIDVKTNCINT